MEAMINSSLVSALARDLPVAPHTIEMDEDVRRVMERMQTMMPTAKLVAVAQAVGTLAPIMWGHHAAADPMGAELRALSLRHPPIE